MLTIEELRAYDWVAFYDCRTNLKDKKTGAKVGDYLAISGYDNKWKIYNIYGGLPATDIWIGSLSDAVKIAQAIEKVYGEYLAIWEIWQDVDIICIARLSVEHGEAVYNALCELEKLNRTITYNDFITILKEKMK
jgi:hypothetical protein